MNSPFKFLDPYTEADAEVFFGRAEETEQLYRLLGETDIVLVYGQSGTGKTSLIQCGLSNRIRKTDWHPLWVRRGSDINQSLIQEIGAAAVTPIEPGTTVVSALRSVYLDHLRPVYLIFDQFEELFVLGTDEEREAFYKTISDVIASGVACKVIVSLREEYLAQLNAFEQLIPNLFNKRLRVELMSPAKIEGVISGTCTAHDIALEHGINTGRLIIDKLSDCGKSYVQLAYLQVYLDSLYQLAVKADDDGSLVFTDADVEETGQLGDVMSDFLDGRIRAIEAELRPAHPDMPAGGIRLLLEEFVSVEGTKQPSTREELVARMPNCETWVDPALASLQASRVLREGDNRFELAHDALAARIVETRSDERKALLQVRRIVRDGLASHTQTKGSYLQSEELAIVTRACRQIDPVTNQPRLILTDEEQAFVTRSRQSRRRRLLGIGAIAAFIALALLILLAIIGETQLSADKNRLQAENARIQANDSTDNTAWLGYLLLIGISPNDQTDEDNLSVVRMQMMQNALLENSLRDLDHDESDFWSRLSEHISELEGDLLNGLAPLDPAGTSGAFLEKLSAEQKQILARSPDDWDARIRYKAVLQRLFFLSNARSPEHENYGAQLVNVMNYKGSESALDYGYNIALICSTLAYEGTPSPACKGIDPLQECELPFTVSKPDGIPQVDCTTDALPQEEDQG